MRLKRDYKIGALLRFKWYDNWRDEFERPENFRISKEISSLSSNSNGMTVGKMNMRNQIILGLSKDVLKVTRV